MSIKRNIIANFTGQFYVVMSGIIFVPIYVKHMGAEAYGLVGFYAMLQAWFMLLDMGLTPTISRETARFQGGGIDALTLRRLLRALEGFFLGIAILGALLLSFSSHFIANQWLKIRDLSLGEVQHVIILISLIIALRWVCGLYRGAINGFEQIVWLNIFNIGIATIRFAMIIPVLIFIGATPTIFFIFQLFVAVLELSILVMQTYRLLPKVNSDQPISWQWQPIRGILKFSLTIAFTGGVWVIVTQADKLLLSNLLLLSEYTYFTLAVLVANGVMIVAGPISGALLPRMTKLNAEGDEAGMIRLYRNATQLVAVIAIPAALVLAFFAEQVLWVWTGNPVIAQHAAKVLTLYALGNGILVLAAFPFYLQFAKGDLKLHLIGNFIFILIFIPSLIWATKSYGMIGAGYVWIFTNLLPFFLWLPYVHRRFVKGLHIQWLLQDVGQVVISPVIAMFFLHKYLLLPVTRLTLTITIIAVGVALCIIAAGGSSWIRQEVSGRWRTQFFKQRQG